MSDIAVEPSAAEPVETPAAAPSEPVAAEPAAPETPAAPAFDADAARSFFGTPEGQQVLVEQLQSLIPDEPYDQQPQDGPPEFEFDPLGDDPTGQIRELLRGELGPILQEVLGPYTPALEATAQAQAKTWADEKFAGLPADVRDLSFKEDGDRELAIFLANGIGAPNPNVGFRGLHPDQAIAEATRLMHERDKRNAEQAVAAYRAGLEGGDPTAPAGGGDLGLNAGPAGVRSERMPQSVQEAAQMARERRGY